MITVDPDVFSESMNQRVRQDGSFFSVQYAVTYRCNLACVHCYVEGADRGAPPELTLAEADRLFAQFAAEGCLHCTFTGGDPLVREDFEDLWTMVARHGIRRLLFTNATLIDERKAAFLREFPPDWVEISIYGADAATHDAVTRIPGSFEATFAGIRRLEAAGLRARLKTIVMRSNVHQIGAIRKLAESVGDGSFRLDGQLMGAYAGGIDMDALRVDADQLAAIEMEHGDNMMEVWCHEIKRLEGHTRKNLYFCGAAKNSAYLSPWGDLHPCLCASHVSVPLRRVPVSEALTSLRAKIFGRPVPEGHTCTNCSEAIFCQSCPAVADLDAGDELGISPYRCAVAKSRAVRYNENSLDLLKTTIPRLYPLETLC